MVVRVSSADSFSVSMPEKGLAGVVLHYALL